MSKIIIVSYQKEYSLDFYELNKAWITQFWSLEESDFQDLLDPESSIISRGGQLFFAIFESKVVGTCAMIKCENNVFEMAKMTVKKSFRGQGISKMLLDRCIEFAKSKKASNIFLISNHTLTIARNLYDKYGFKEVLLDSKKYNRGNVKMVLNI